MSFGVTIVALLAGAPLAATLQPAAEIELSGRVIRVADIANLSGADSVTRLRLGERIVARLPAGRSTLAVSRAALADLIRRTVPALAVAGNDSAEVIRFRAPAAPPAAGLGTHCFALSRPVSRGVPLTLEDVEPAACDARNTRASILFDRPGAVARAGEDLAEGSYLGRVTLPRERGVDRGDRLTLRSVVGPVRIERDVTALQPGRPGRRIFVRVEDGQTIAAPLAGSNGERAE